MAKRRGYFPTIEGDLKTWLMNLRDKIDTHGSTIGLTGSEINSIKSNVNQLISKIDAVEQKRNDFHEAVADKNTFKNATTKSIGTLISRGKLTSGYTTAIGEDLDVIGEEITIDSGTAKPIIKSKKVPNGWEFSFNLLNFFHGIKLYRKRPGRPGRAGRMPEHIPSCSRNVCSKFPYRYCPLSQDAASFFFASMISSEFPIYRACFGSNPASFSARIRDACV